jgi:hypothetical protein
MIKLWGQPDIYDISILIESENLVELSQKVNQMKDKSCNLSLDGYSTRGNLGVRISKPKKMFPSLICTSEKSN